MQAMHDESINFPRLQLSKHGEFCFTEKDLFSCYIKQIGLMNVFSFVQWSKHFHSVKDEMFHSTRLRLVEWNISSFTSWKYFYRCTHKHSLFVHYFMLKTPKFALILLWGHFWPQRTIFPSPPSSDSVPDVSPPPPSDSVPDRDRKSFRKASPPHQKFCEKTLVCTQSGMRISSWKAGTSLFLITKLTSFLFQNNLRKCFTSFFNHFQTFW